MREYSEPHGPRLITHFLTHYQAFMEHVMCQCRGGQEDKVGVGNQRVVEDKCWVWDASFLWRANFDPWR